MLSTFQTPYLPLECNPCQSWGWLGSILLALYFYLIVFYLLHRVTHGEISMNFCISFAKKIVLTITLKLKLLAKFFWRVPSQCALNVFTLWCIEKNDNICTVLGRKQNKLFLAAAKHSRLQSLWKFPGCIQKRQIRILHTTFGEICLEQSDQFSDRLV